MHFEDLTQARQCGFEPTFIKDDTGTTFSFILRTHVDGKYGPRISKLQQDKLDSAICGHWASTFRFGCGEFDLQFDHIYTITNNCCFEWYDYENTYQYENFYLSDIMENDCQAEQIEIYQLCWLMIIDMTQIVAFYISVVFTKV